MECGLGDDMKLRHGRYAIEEGKLYLDGKAVPVSRLEAVLVMQIVAMAEASDLLADKLLRERAGASGLPDHPGDWPEEAGT